MNGTFKLLEGINKNSCINQTILSFKCDMSLGKVNSCIEDLEFNNYIIKEVNGR